jgi:hypothetical protein
MSPACIDIGQNMANVLRAFDFYWLRDSISDEIQLQSAVHFILLDSVCGRLPKDR